jgi:hypothetical protein
MGLIAVYFSCFFFPVCIGLWKMYLEPFDVDPDNPEEAFGRDE